MSLSPAITPNESSFRSDSISAEKKKCDVIIKTRILTVINVSMDDDAVFLSSQWDIATNPEQNISETEVMVSKDDIGPCSNNKEINRSEMNITEHL